jgi:endo-1,3-1,4-beta-glycanase ExoK
MNRFGLASLCLLGVLLFPCVASATKSAELYTSPAYGYGRFEARVRFAPGDGVVSAFFLWKDGSEQAGTFWNELDYEKIGATCQLQTNALYGNPSASHTEKPTTSADLCGGFHVYGYEWTADYIAWSLDGTEIRRETGDAAAAYAQNASALQIHFNIWPGDSSFGGNFSPSILPVYQYIDWVQFSSFANGAFTLAWREDFNASTAPSGWLTGNWGSPKNLSTHDPLNVNFLSGCAVLSLTDDAATGATGAMTDGCTMGVAGATGVGGNSGTAGMSGAAAGASTGGASSTGGMPAAAGGASGAGGTSASGATGGSGGRSETTGVGGSSGSPATTGGASGAGSSGAPTSAGTAGAPASGLAGGDSSGGSNATGGTPAAGGTETAAGAPGGERTKTSDTSGCGCRVPSDDSSRREPGIGAAVLLALAGVLRRRRGPPARGS